MHLFRMFRTPIATPLLAPEDGAMSGSADDGAAGDGYEPGLESGADPDPAGDEGGDPEGLDAGAGGDGEEDDVDLIVGRDEDDDDQTKPIEERHRKTLRDKRRLQRKLAKLSPLSQRLKGVDLDRALANASRYEALEARLAGNRKLWRQLTEEPEGAEDEGETAPAARRGTRDEEPFDESKLPWDTETASGKYFVGMVKQQRTLQTDLQRAMKRIDQLEGGITQERQAQVQTKWVEGMKAASKQIKDPKVRTMFEDAVKGAFHVAQFQRRQVDPNTVIKHYLNLAGVSPTTKAIAAGAAKQRMAQGNQQLPRHQAGGPGASTPARSGKERPADVHRRIRAIG